MVGSRGGMWLGAGNEFGLEEFDLKYVEDEFRLEQGRNLDWSRR